MVGGSFTGLTVRKNELLADAPPESATVLLIAAVPNRLAAGITANLPFDPLPSKTIFASGTRPGLDEWPRTVKLPAAVSRSLMVNGIAGVGVSSSVAWSGTLEMAGG